MIDVPSEIVSRYRSGEREILVSRDVFVAYDDAIFRGNGYMVRTGVTGAFNERQTLYYKDAKVIHQVK